VKIALSGAGIFYYEDARKEYLYQFFSEAGDLNFRKDLLE
jgi:hypothetical protein